LWHRSSPLCWSPFSRSAHCLRAVLRLIWTPRNPAVATKPIANRRIAHSQQCGTVRISFWKKARSLKRQRRLQQMFSGRLPPIFRCRMSFPVSAAKPESRTPRACTFACEYSWSKNTHRELSSGEAVCVTSVTWEAVKDLIRRIYMKQMTTSVLSLAALLMLTLGTSFAKSAKAECCNGSPCCNKAAACCHLK
jgi:hypothetical protein